MSFALMICCTPMLFTAHSPRHTERDYSLSDIKQQIEDHRLMVRMCGPLSAMRACALTGKKVDVDATLARYRCGDQLDGRRGRSAPAGLNTQPHEHLPLSEGISVREVVTLCRDLGLEARGIRTNVQSLADLPTPSILLLNKDRHCAVLESSAHHGLVRVWDPAELTSKEIDIETLSKLWSGHAIVFATMPWTRRLIDIINVGAAVVTIALLAWSRRAAGTRE